MPRDPHHPTPDPWRLARADHWASAYRLDHAPTRGPKPTDAAPRPSDPRANVVPFSRQRA
jgi:hypothetical protein